MRATLFALTRCLTAVLTVWCLGCQSFELVLEHWVERPPAAADEGTARAAWDTGASGVEHGGDACPCASGHAVTSLELGGTALPTEAPLPAETHLTALASIAPEPLDPPPQA